MTSKKYSNPAKDEATEAANVQRPSENGEAAETEKCIDPADFQDLKIALVCDWLTNVGGAEKVILKIHQLFPEAPIYTSQYRPKKIDWFTDADVRTGWLQRFPVKLRRFLGPLRQVYFSRLDLSEYDLVISITGAEAKAVKAPNGVHVSYCHVPTQYYWQMYDEYIKNPGFGILNPVVRLFFRLLVTPLRYFDLRAAQTPDYFVTISEYAKEQIKKYYGREAVVVHPPVEIEEFRSERKQAPIRLEDGYELSDAYVMAARQVNWKHADLVVRAAFLAQRHVVLIGEGPEHRKLLKMAKGSDLVQFLPLMRKEELAKYLSQARGFLFPSLEPFGIAPVEALAAGCPVVAFGEGGARDYIKDGENGVLFDEQTPIALAEGMLRLEKLRLDRKKIAKTAEGFGAERFDRELLEFIGGCEGVEVESRGTREELAEAGQKAEGDVEKNREETKGSGKAKEAGKTEQAKEVKEAEKSNKKAGGVDKKATGGARKTVDEKKTAGGAKKTKKGTSVRKAQKIEKTVKAVQKALEKPRQSEEKRVPTSASAADARTFPKIGEDVERTRELVKKAEAAKEANRPAFPKIGESK